MNYDEELLGLESYLVILKAYVGLYKDQFLSVD